MSVIKGRFSHNTEPEKYLVIATAFFIHTYILENWQGMAVGTTISKENDVTIRENLLIPEKD